MLRTQALGSDEMQMSRIALGCMGLARVSDPSKLGPEQKRRAIGAFEAALDLGINFFDHADIYGGGASEAVFKDCLAAVPGVRQKIFIATKVGICKSPPGYYDHSPKYMRDGLRGSLERMGVEYVDLYQLHRPDPLSDPRETAGVLEELVREGLVRQVGVSNYYPHQVLALRQFLSIPVVANQISISLLRLDPIYEGAARGGGDGVLDQCEQLSITPLAYSPLGAGWLTGRREAPADHPRRDTIERIMKALREMSASYDGATPTQLAIAWLLKHPAGIIPIVGSTNPDHIKEAAAGAKIELSRADWYRLWIAARGEPVP